MKNTDRRYNSSKTCQKLNGACVGLESTAEELLERIHVLSLKINSYYSSEDPIQKTNNIR